MLLNKKPSFWLFLSLAFAGLIWQLMSICQLYFQYKVVTRITIFIPTIINPLALNLCLKMPLIFDYEGIRNSTGNNWTYDAIISGRRLATENKLMHNLTIEQMFKFTPQENDVVDRVRLTNSSLSSDLVVQGDDAKKLVKVDKYLYMIYVCYRISLIRDEPLSLQHFASSLRSHGMIRFYQFSERLNRSDVIKFAVGAVDEIPFRGLMISPYIFREYNDSLKEAKYGYFVSHHYSMEVELLEYPFETLCYNYTTIGFKEEMECIEACVTKKTWDRFKKLPFTAAITASSKKKVLSGIDLEDNDKNRDFIKIQTDCATKECSRLSCRNTQYFTFTNSFSRRFFRWKHVIPLQTSFIISSRPQFTVVELITYLLGTISTWTGLSIMSMNPIDLATKIWRNINTQKTSAVTKKHLIPIRRTVHPIYPLQSTQGKRERQQTLFEYKKQYNNIRLPHRRCK